MGFACSMPFCVLKMGNFFYFFSVNGTKDLKAREETSKETLEETNILCLFLVIYGVYMRRNGKETQICTHFPTKVTYILTRVRIN